MKKFLLLAVLAPLFWLGTASAQNAKFEVRWSFAGVEEGYDHPNKCVVYVDGSQVGESSVKPETSKNKMKVSVPSGKHIIRVENWAEYQGNWEVHSIENSYSLDCIWEQTITINKKGRLTLTFDLDNGRKASILLK